ncbi:hypothetical protein KA005_55095 [bacterium]|nr:hypothetical protein [Calditrichia bacterium]MCK4824992.1 hypothetical protein [bacterium]
MQKSTNKFILKSRPSGEVSPDNFELYVAPFELESVITGDGIAEVIDSKSEKFKSEDLLVGILPWQEYAVIDPKKVEKIIPDENIIEGFEKLPTAFIGLFQGENIGKQLVKV